MSEDDRPIATGFGVGDVARVLRRRAGWLLLALAIGAAAGAAVHRALPERFTGESTLLVESTWIPKGFAEGSVGNSMRSQVQTLRHRVTSDRALAGVLAQVGPERFGSLPDDSARAGLLRRDLVLEIVDGTSPDAAVIRIAFASSDPSLARDVVRASTRQLIEEREAERSEQSTATEDLLREQTTQLRDQLMQKARELDQIESESGGALTADAQGSETRALRVSELTALQELEAALASAQATFTERHPSVRKLHAELARQRALLAAPPPNQAAGGEPSARYRALLRDYDSNVRTYEALSARQIEARMAKRLTESDASPELRVLREAYLLVFPGPADLPAFLGGGAVLGLALATALFLVPALRRASFSGVEELADQTGLPVVAAIPPLARKSSSGEAELADVVLSSDPRSIAAEQYRRFLPHLPAASDHALVLVTSAERGEGKSLTAANLAATAAADGGRRVLLIDADLRRPTQHRLLDLAREPGLGDGAFGELELDRLVRATAVPRLFAVTAGRRCDGPLPLLASESFARLIAAARERFDLVIVDAPPLQVVVDAHLLARFAAMAIFVIRADHTPRAVVLRALDGLHVPVGLVLNGIGAASYRRHYRSDPRGAAYPIESEA